MKFSTYESAVNPNVMQNVPVHVSRDPNAYGTRGGEWKALGQLANIGLEMHKKATDGKVLEANAEYNRLMSEGTSTLMQRKEGEALTITDDYDKLQKDVLRQVKKKYGGYIGYGAGQEAFNAYTMRDDATRRSGVVRYQQAQTDAYRETQYNNQLAACRSAAIEGGGRVEDVNGALARMEAVVDSRFGEYGGEKLVEQKRIAAGQIVGDAVAMAINTGDYAKAETLLSTYRGLLPTNAYIDAKTKLHKQQEIRREYIAVDDIAAKCRDANGKIDLNRAREMVAGMYGRNATKQPMQGVYPGTEDDWTGGVRAEGRINNVSLMKQWDPKWKDIAFSQGTLATSGCAPTAMAMALSWRLGKYVTPVDVANFAMESGLVENGVQGASFVPAVAEHFGVQMEQTDDKEKVIELLKQGVPVVAAHDPGRFTDGGHWIVYAGIDEDGRVIVNDPNGGVRHSDDASFSLDEIFNQESADYYVLTDTSNRLVSAYDPEKMEKMMRMIEAKAKSEDAQQRQAVSAYQESVMQQMKDAGNYEDAIGLLENADLPMDKMNTLRNAAERYYNVKRDGTPRGRSARAESGDGPMWEGKPYNPKKDYKLVQKMDIQFNNGKNPTASEWTEMEDAAYRIRHSGILSDEQAEELYNLNESSGLVTDYLDEGHSIPETYEWLLASGATPVAAFMVISEVHRNYKAIGKAEPLFDEDEYEEAEQGGKF